MYYPKEIIQFDIADITCMRNNIIENYNHCKNLLNDDNREYFNKFRLDEVVDKINELVVYLNSLSLSEEVIGTDDTFDFNTSTCKRCRFCKQLCKYDKIVFLYDYFIGGLLMLMEQNLFFNDNFFDKINNFISKIDFPDVTLHQNYDTKTVSIWSFEDTLQKFIYMFEDKINPILTSNNDNDYKIVEFSNKINAEKLWHVAKALLNSNLKYVDIDIKYIYTNVITMYEALFLMCNDENCMLTRYNEIFYKLLNF